MKPKKVQSVHATTHQNLIRAFRETVELKLDLEAQDKGYDQLNLSQLTREMPHPIAEIVYKAVRYSRLHDPADLTKIAAWAELEWVHWHEKQGGGDDGPR
jgi:hypothetical protein